MHASAYTSWLKLTNCSLQAPPSFLAGPAHGNGHLVVLLIPCAGHAPEQANKSDGALATSHSIHDSAKKKQIVVKDKHLCCRVVLSTSYSFVRSDSNGKQRLPSCSKLRSRSIRRRFHRQPGDCAGRGTYMAYAT